MLIEHDRLRMAMLVNSHFSFITVVVLDITGTIEPRVGSGKMHCLRLRWMRGSEGEMGVNLCLYFGGVRHRN